MQSMKHTQHIEKILAGTSISAVSAETGLATSTLHRLLLKHPDYAKAKAEGKLYAKGIPPKLEELAHGAWRAAIDEVVIGRKSAKSVADAMSYPLASFMKAIRYAYPDIDMRYRNATPQEAATRKLESRRKALSRAEKALSELSVQ